MLIKQISLATIGFELVTKRTHKRVFHEEMNLVVPWTELVGLIHRFPSSGTTAKGGRPTFAVKTMLRIHLPSTMVWPVGPRHARGLA